MEVIELINKFLEFEDNKENLSFKFQCNETLMWPFFRCRIFRDMNVKTGANMEPNYLYNRGNDNYRYFIGRNIIKNPYLQAKRDIIFHGSNFNNIRLSNGAYLNKYVDYYANIFPNKTLLIEEGIFESVEYKRVFNNIAYIDFIDNLVCYKIKYDKVNSRDEKTIVRFIKYLEEKMPYKFSRIYYRNLKSNMIITSLKLKYYYRYFELLFRKISPKFYFKVSGSDGGRAYIFRILNEMGVITADLQHGAIINNEPYNFGKLLLTDNEYRKYVPKYICTLGERWHSHSSPSEFKLLGSPYMYEDVKKFKRKKKNNNIKEILWVSSFNYKEYIKFLNKFLIDLPFNYRVILKVHPQEDMSKYKVLNKYKNFELTSTKNLYELFATCDYVVGEHSTALFEAIFYNLPVFILDNNLSCWAMPKDFGKWFKTSDELLYLINRKYAESYDTEFVNYYWNKRWKENYINFINERGIL